MTLLCDSLNHFYLIVLCSICVMHLHFKSCGLGSVTFKQLTNLFPCQPLCLISSHFIPTLFKGTWTAWKAKGQFTWMCWAGPLQCQSIQIHACNHLVKKSGSFAPSQQLCKTDVLKIKEIKFLLEELIFLILGMWVCGSCGVVNKD